MRHVSLTDTNELIASVVCQTTTDWRFGPNRNIESTLVNLVPYPRIHALTAAHCFKKKQRDENALSNLLSSNLVTSKSQDQYVNFVASLYMPPCYQNLGDIITFKT